MGSESFGVFAKAYMIRFVVVEVEFYVRKLFILFIMIFLFSYYLSISQEDMSLSLFSSSFLYLLTSLFLSS